MPGGRLPFYNRIDKVLETYILQPLSCSKKKEGKCNKKYFSMGSSAKKKREKKKDFQVSRRRIAKHRHSDHNSF